jgi:thiol-disulfide isomerase/thioredoxin
MGTYCARTSIGAAMVAAFLATSSRADDAATAPRAEPGVAVESPAAEATPVQTVSTISPVQKQRPLFPYTSYPDAWTAAQKSNRPILLFVTMPGCPHCEKMMEETYHLPKVEHFISESFESIHVNSNTQPTLVKSLKVKWFPTTVLVGPNNKVVDVIEGYVDAKTFERRLQTGLASADSSTQTR